MQIETSGTVVVHALIENLADVYSSRGGSPDGNEIRSIEVDNAVVEPGAAKLSLPTRYIRRLGLTPLRERRIRSTAGIIVQREFSPVRLTVQGRDVVSEVCEVPDECPVLIGRIALLGLDFVVDLQGQKLIGNPEHGGEAMLELY